MKRNEFFKTIGLLGLAAALPKFLLGKSKPIQLETVNFTTQCIPEPEFEKIWLIDRAIMPKDIKFGDWLNKIKKEKICLYSTSIIKIQPKDLKTTVCNGVSPYIKIHCSVKDITHKDIRDNHSELFDNCAFIDVESGWFCDKDWNCNYLSIERFPRKITGGLSTC